MTDQTILTEQGEPADFIATLKRGKTFTLGTNPATRFAQNVEKPISAAMKAKLEEKAVDQITVGHDDDGEPEIDYRQKFAFRKVGEEAEPEAGPRPRQRGRRVHAG